jgi:hypothetical protein
MKQGLKFAVCQLLFSTSGISDSGIGRMRKISKSQNFGTELKSHEIHEDIAFMRPSARALIPDLYFFRCASSCMSPSSKQ